MDYSSLLVESKVYERFGVVPAEELVEQFPFGKNEDAPRKKEYFGKMVKLTSPRYEAIARYGFQCQQCGLMGIVFILERSRAQNTNKCHFNLYGINKKGELEQLTIDHVTPRAKGGLDILENKQILCFTCNNKKGDRLI